MTKTLLLTFLAVAFCYSSHVSAQVHQCESCTDGAYSQVVNPRVAKLRQLSDGRPFLQSLVDNQWTRTISVYGGLEDLNLNGADIFDGQVDLDSGSAFGVEVGRRHSSYLRSTFDYTYRDNDLTDAGGTSNGDIQIHSIMKNLYLDLVPHRDITPYVGIGFGAAHVDAAGTFAGTPGVISGESTAAYQLMGGVSARLLDRFSLFGEYRFFSTNDIFSESGGAALNKGEYSAHNVFLGLRFGF